MMSYLHIVFVLLKYSAGESLDKFFVQQLFWWYDKSIWGFDDPRNILRIYPKSYDRMNAFISHNNQLTKLHFTILSLLDTMLTQKGHDDQSTSKLKITTDFIFYFIFPFSSYRVC